MLVNLPPMPVTKQTQKQDKKKSAESADGQNAATQSGQQAVELPDYLKVRKQIASGSDGNAKHFKAFKAAIAGMKSGGFKFPEPNAFDDATNTTWGAKPDVLNTVLIQLKTLQKQYLASGSTQFDLGTLAQVKTLLNNYLASKQAKTSDHKYQERAASVELLRQHIDDYVQYRAAQAPDATEVKASFEEQSAQSTDSLSKAAEQASSAKVMAKRAIQRNELKGKWSKWENGLPTIADFKAFIYVSKINQSDKSQDQIVKLLEQIKTIKDKDPKASIDSYKAQIISLAKGYLNTNPNALKDSSDWQRRSAALELLIDQVKGSMGTEKVEDAESKIVEDQVRRQRDDLDSQTNNPDDLGITSSRWQTHVTNFKALLQAHQGKIWLPTGDQLHDGINTTYVSSIPKELKQVQKLLDVLKTKLPKLFEQGLSTDELDLNTQKLIATYVKGIDNYLSLHLQSDAALNYEDVSFQARALAVEKLRAQLTKVRKAAPKAKDEDLDERVVGLAEKDNDAEWIEALANEDQALKDREAVKGNAPKFNFEVAPSKAEFDQASNIGWSFASQEKGEILKTLEALGNVYGVSSATKLDDLKQKNGSTASDPTEQDNKQVDFQYLLVSLNGIRAQAQQYLTGTIALETGQNMQQRVLVFQALKDRIDGAIQRIEQDAYVKQVLGGAGLVAQDAKALAEMKMANAKRREAMEAINSDKAGENIKPFAAKIAKGQIPTQDEFKNALKAHWYSSVGNADAVYPMLETLANDFPGLTADKVAANEADNEALFKTLKGIRGKLDEFLASDMATSNDADNQKKAAIVMKLHNLVGKMIKGFNTDLQSRDFEQEEADQEAEEIRQREEARQAALQGKRDELTASIDRLDGADVTGLKDETRYRKAVLDIKKTPPGRMVAPALFDNATYIGVMTKGGEAKDSVTNYLQQVESDTPELIKGTPVTSLAKASGYQDQGVLKSTLRVNTRRAVAIQNWAARYKNSPDANLEKGEGYHRRFLAFEAVGMVMENFKTEASQAMTDLDMSAREIERAQDISESDEMSAESKKLNVKYDSYAANPILQSIYGKIGDLVEDENSSASISASVKIPIYPPVYLGGEVNVEAEKGGEEELSSRIELGLTVGADLGAVDVSGTIGGYIETAGKDSNELAALATYGFYKRCQQAGGILERFANAIMGGQESAEQTAGLIEDNILRGNENAYVELGAYGKLGVDVGGGSFAAEAKGVSGYRYDATTAGKDSGRSVLGGSIEIGGKFAGMSLSGAYTYLRDLTNGEALTNELSASLNLQIPWGSRATSIADFILYISGKAKEYTEVQAQSMSSEINSLREEVRTLEAVNSSGEFDDTLSEKKAQLQKLIEEANNAETAVTELDGQMEQASGQVKQGFMGKISDAVGSVTEKDPRTMFEESGLVTELNDLVEQVGNGILDDDEFVSKVSNFISGRSDESDDDTTIVTGLINHLNDKLGLTALGERQEAIMAKLQEKLGITALLDKTGVSEISKGLEADPDESFNIDASFDFIEKQFELSVSSVEAYELSAKALSFEMEKATKVLIISVGKGGISIEPFQTFFNDSKATFQNVKSRFE